MLCERLFRQATVVRRLEMAVNRVVALSRPSSSYVLNRVCQHRESPKIINVGVRVKNIVQTGCG
jgi:hypothetical protein